MVLDDHKKLKICDFGFARTYQQAARMTICGTEDWMAPEMLLGDSYDEKVDVFSYGVVLVEIITRKKIAGNFQRGPQSLFAMDIPLIKSSTPSDCPPALLDLTIQCVSDEPSQRPTFRYIIQKLNEIRINLVPASPEPPVPVTPPKSPTLKVPTLTVPPSSPSAVKPKLSPRSAIRNQRKPRCSFVELNELSMSFENEEKVEEILVRVFSASATHGW
jgi:serine/threonine protein kinase